MKSINEYFDAILVINLDRSPDRWRRVREQADKHNFTVERFEGYDFADYKYLPDHMRGAMENAMGGCTASHGAILAYIAQEGFKRATDQYIDEALPTRRIVLPGSHVQH